MDNEDITALLQTEAQETKEQRYKIVIDSVLTNKNLIDYICEEKEKGSINFMELRKEMKNYCSNPHIPDCELKEGILFYLKPTLQRVAFSNKQPKKEQYNGSDLGFCFAGKSIGSYLI